MLAQVSGIVRDVLSNYLGLDISRYFLHPIIYLIILFLVWRLWKFYIWPEIDHDEPKAIPYWVPCWSLYTSWQIQQANYSYRAR